MTSTVGVIALATIGVLGAIAPAMAASPAQSRIAPHNPADMAPLSPSAR